MTLLSIQPVCFVREFLFFCGSGAETSTPISAMDHFRLKQGCIGLIVVAAQISIKIRKCLVKCDLPSYSLPYFANPFAKNRAHVGRRAKHVLLMNAFYKHTHCFR